MDNSGRNLFQATTEPFVIKALRTFQDTSH